VKTFRVIIPPIVQEQIRSQVLYIARDSIDNALAWEDRLRTEIMRIGSVPTGYPVDEAATGRLGEEVRKMVFEKTYLVFYRVHTERRAIELLNFRHGARLPRRGEP
jgi:plasmid stabilization system protein ParE